METIGDIQLKCTGGAMLDHAGGKADCVLDFDAERIFFKMVKGVVVVFKSDVHLLPFMRSCVFQIVFLFIKAAAEMYTPVKGTSCASLWALYHSSLDFEISFITS